MTWIPLSVEVEKFEDLRDNGCYFVDKTLFIKELFDIKGEVNLFYPSPPLWKDTEYKHAPVFLGSFLWASWSVTIMGFS